MLPATSAGTPAASNIAPSSAVVVVFPFVPVIPMIGFSSRRAPSSISEMTGMPRATCCRHRRRVRRDAGALDDELDAVEERVVPGAELDIALDPGDVEVGVRVMGRDGRAPALGAP